MNKRLALLVLGCAAAAFAQQQPTITPNTSTLTFLTNEPFSQQFACTGTCPTSFLTWDISAGTLPAGITFSQTGLMNGTPSVNGQTGTFTVRLRQSTPSLITVATRTYNYQTVPRPAFLTASPLPAVTSGASFTRTITANQNGLWDVASSNLPSGVTFNLPSNGGSSITLSGSFPQVTSPQTYTFTVFFSAFAFVESNIQRVYAITVNPPITTNPTLPQGAVGTVYSETLGISGGTPPYNVALANGTLPPGVNLNFSNGVLAGIPTVAGNYAFSVRITDSGGGAGSGTYLLTIRGAAVTITSGTPQTGRVGEVYNFVFRAAGGPASSVFNWSLNGGILPPGLTLGSTGILSGVPERDGVYTFSVRATSNLDPNATATGDYSLQILARTLTLSGDPPAATVLAPYTFGFTTTGGVPPYTYQVISGALPQGLILNTNTGALTGTPTGSGSSTFTLQVTDAQQQRAARTVTIIVSAALRIVTEALEDAVVRAPYNATLQAAGGTAPYTFTLEGLLPQGLALSAAGVITGTPAAPATNTFTIRVTDAQRATTTRQFTLVTRAALAISTAQLPRAIRGEPYGVQIAAEGGVAPYEFSLGGGTLPAGLTLGSTGLLSGTPTAPASVTELRIRVTDRRSSLAERTLSLTLVARPVITTTTLPNGTVGTAYQATLAGEGAPPLAWRVAAGQLPVGITLNSATGALTGRPTSPGNASFTIELSDATGLLATRPFTVNVSAVPIPGVSITQLPEAVAPGQQPAFGVALNGPAPVALRGTVTLQHAAETGPADPAVVFSNGQTSIDFTIAQGQTAGAALANAPLVLQTGTVAGTITLRLTLRDAATGAVLGANPAATQTLRVNRAAPGITSVRINRTAAGFEVLVTGFSNTREISAATFRFTAASGSALTAADVTVPVQAEFQRWFTSAAAAPFGGQFLLTVPFTVQGGGAGNLASVQVSITNGVGTSSGSATF